VCFYTVLRLIAGVFLRGPHDNSKLCLCANAQEDSLRGAQDGCWWALCSSRTVLFEFVCHYFGFSRLWVDETQETGSPPEVEMERHGGGSAGKREEQTP